MGDVVAVLAVAVALMAGITYELAGLTVPGWHTISYSAHRSWLVRTTILSSVVLLFVILTLHFNHAVLR